MGCPIHSEGAQQVTQPVCGEVLVLRCHWGASAGHCHQCIAFMGEAHLRAFWGLIYQKEHSEHHSPCVESCWH